MRTAKTTTDFSNKPRIEQLVQRMDSGNKPESRPRRYFLRLFNSKMARLYWPQKEFRRLSRIVLNTRPMLFGALGTVYARAAMAVVAPPQWKTIKHLEESWGVNNANRNRFVGLQCWLLTVYVTLLALVLFAIFQLNPSSWLALIIGMLSSTAVIIFLAISMSVALWRLSVVVSRQPKNYPTWLLGR